MNIDRITCGVALKAFSAASCGLFAGGALYITLVESPARMTNDATSAVMMWKPSFNKAKSLQIKLLIMSSLSAFGAHVCLRPKHHNWLVVGGAMLSIIPYTVVFIAPVNKELLQTDKCISKGDSWMVEMLNRWSSRHSIRTAISVILFIQIL